MTLNLLLFAITFTIFLEIEFDFIFYVPYRSEEISPSEPRTFGVNRGCMELQEAALDASWYEGFHRLEYFASRTFNLELGIISAFSLNVILQINSIHIHI